VFTLEEGLEGSRLKSSTIGFNMSISLDMIAAIIM
jgi:hypothetical protein